MGNNRFVVANALAIARESGREKGLSYLERQVTGKNTPQRTTREWFDKKCDEHGVPRR